MVQRIKDMVRMPQIKRPSRENVDQLITKYIPPGKVVEIADKLKKESLSIRVRELVSRYEKFTGVAEIMAIQNTVIDAQVIREFYLELCVISGIRMRSFVWIVLFASQRLF